MTQKDFGRSLMKDGVVIYDIGEVDGKGIMFGYVKFEIIYWTSKWRGEVGRWI